jgi:hypothetical protein
MNPRSSVIEIQIYAQTKTGKARLAMFPSFARRLMSQIRPFALSTTQRRVQQRACKAKITRLIRKTQQHQMKPCSILSGGFDRIATGLQDEVVLA